MHIELYTDGACSGNPGPGGYGAILKYGKHEKELSEGFLCTTNNRMELMAVIKGLEALTKEGQEILIVSDSEYVVNAVTKGWLWNWEKKNYKNKANADLWKQYAALHRKHKISFKWIKGHAGHPFNERCDRLAVASIKNDFLKEDIGFTGTRPDSLKKIIG